LDSEAELRPGRGLIRHRQLIDRHSHGPTVLPSRHSRRYPLMLKMFRSFIHDRRAWLAVLASALVVLSTGCGGGGQSDTSQATTTAASNGSGGGASSSKAEFVKQASAICTETKERSTAAFREYGEKNSVPSSGPGLEAKAADLVATVFVPIYEQQI